jgi:hypothetical protein
MTGTVANLWHGSSRRPRCVPTRGAPTPLRSRRRVCWRRSSAGSRPRPSPSSRPRPPCATEPLLGALLDTPSGRTDFDVLRTLPFTEQTGKGLLLHDVVRDTVGHDLSMRDPDRRRTYRRRTVAHLTEQRNGTTVDPWLHTADLIFLIENPVLRDTCFPSARPPTGSSPPRPGTGPSFRHRHSARVARGRGDPGSVVGASSGDVLRGPRTGRGRRGRRPDRRAQRARSAAPGRRPIARV